MKKTGTGVAKTKPNKGAMALATKQVSRRKHRQQLKKLPKNDQGSSPLRSRKRLMSRKTLVQTVWMLKKALIPPHPPRLVV